MMTTEVI